MFAVVHKSPEQCFENLVTLSGRVIQCCCVLQGRTELMRLILNGDHDGDYTLASQLVVRRWRDIDPKAQSDDGSTVMSLAKERSLTQISEYLFASQAYHSSKEVCSKRQRPRNTQLMDLCVFGSNYSLPHKCLFSTAKGWALTKT